METTNVISQLQFQWQSFIGTPKYRTLLKQDSVNLVSFSSLMNTIDICTKPHPTWLNVEPDPLNWMRHLISAVSPVLLTVTSSESWNISAFLFCCIWKLLFFFPTYVHFHLPITTHCVRYFVIGDLPYLYYGCSFFPYLPSGFRSDISKYEIDIFDAQF